MDKMLPKNISIIEEKGKFTDKDPGFLVAKGRFPGKTKKERVKAKNEHIDKLSKAIFSSLVNQGYANVRAIGNEAKGNAVEAYTNAQEECLKKEIKICFDTERQIGNLGPLRSGKHVENVQAIMFKILDYKDWKGNEDD